MKFIKSLCSLLLSQHDVSVALTLLVALVMVSSCGSDNTDDPKPNPDPIVPSEKTGNISFDIPIPEGIGDGSMSSPLKIEKGQSLDITITQKSEYKDPDGSTFTCEPKAHIAVNTLADTIKAANVTELTAIIGNGYEIKTDTEGTEPVRNSNLQTFKIGQQNIVFDLSHEVFTYINSRKEKIEMPYMRLNPASLGGSVATETESKSRSMAVALSAVSVKPIASSRSTTVTDSTLYEVTAQFTLNAESVNTRDKSQKSIAMAVSYIGIVETVTELADPVASLTYELHTEGATHSSQSPFIMSDGRSMTIIMDQKSSYTDGYGITTECSPRATVNLSIDKDTIWVDNVKSLEVFSPKAGGITTEYAATQLFGNDDVTLTADWCFEQGQVIADGQEIAVPYYALGEMTVKDVEVMKLGRDSVFITPPDLNYCTEYFNVTVHLVQTAFAKNVIAPIEDITTEYIVSYIGAVKSELENVEYFPGGEWVDPHDNMALAFYPKVTRRRTYSSGTVLEDVFYDYGHPASPGIGSNFVEGYNEWYSVWVNGYPISYKSIGDSISIMTQSVEVSQLGSISCEKYQDNFYYKDGSNSTYSYPNWNGYILSRPFPEYLNVENCLNDIHYAKDERDNGFYFRHHHYDISYDINWTTEEEGTTTLGGLHAEFGFYDQFLVIDKQKIDFMKSQGLSIKHSIIENNFDDGYRHGKILQLKAEMEFCKKKFTALQIDTIYTKNIPVERSH